MRRYYPQPSKVDLNLTFWDLCKELFRMLVALPREITRFIKEVTDAICSYEYIPDTPEEQAEKQRRAKRTLEEILEEDYNGGITARR